jgi:hypothetical protein
MARVIEVKWKCQCVVEEQTFFVRERYDEEGVVDWMERVVQRKLGEVHMKRSPFCTAIKTEYIKIDLPDKDKGIGFSAKAH